jgi:hypothetical protein
VESTKLDEQEIRGISFKQIAGYTIGVASLLFVYFDIRNEIHINRQETQLTRELVKSMEVTAKEDRDFRRAEMAAIRVELKQISDNQRAFDLRLTVMETIIKSK